MHGVYENSSTVDEGALEKIKQNKKQFPSMLSMVIHSKKNVNVSYIEHEIVIPHHLPMIIWF